MRDKVSPTTNTGLNTMTPAQQRREMQRQAREVKAAQQAAERERREQAKEQARIERERQETVQTAIGTIFGGDKSR
jgi:hypothetical protein